MYSFLIVIWLMQGKDIIFFKVYFIGQINTNDIFKDVIKALNRERGATDL